MTSSSPPGGDSLTGDEETIRAPEEAGGGHTRPMPSDEPAQTIVTPTNDDDDDGGTAYMPNQPPDPNTPTIVTADREATRLSVTDSPQSPPVTPAAPPVDKTRPDTSGSKDTVAAGRVLQSRYRLDKILGRGGFGTAYLAQDIKLNRSCVVKQMLAPPGTSRSELELYQANFAREAGLLVQLNHPGHPNIPEIYDYFSDPSGNYLVMKYIEGQSLSDALNQSGGKLPWREAVRYIVDVCSALEYMHSYGTEPVMHRDIKPANVLLGNDNRVWLVDFGLAKATPVEGSGDLMATQAAGSLGYTPLEQWLGEAVPASDIYAAGATLHYLVTGQSPSQPFGGQFKVQMLKELHGAFTPVRKIDKNLPRSLEAVISRATSAEPAQRPTALQMKEQLEALTSGAQAAALYTFKSGESAKTTRELVDLCDRYRAEAQDYLIGGDFQRWFRMINRNDLAGAAEQAVQQGRNPKDGLEKFLKLIVPNLMLRRTSRLLSGVVRFVLLTLLVVAVVLALLVVGGSFAAGAFARQTIASAAWEFDGLDPESPAIFREDAINESTAAMVGPYFDRLAVDMQPPNRVVLAVAWSGVPLEIPVTVDSAAGLPQLHLSEVNGLPLFLLGDNLSDGINQGIAEAFRQSPVDVTGLEIGDDELRVIVAESRYSNRPAMPTVTPTPTSTPTPAPTGTPSPTPEGLALVSIFNETGEAIILQVGDELYELDIDDSKAIEVLAGTYSFSVTYPDTGFTGAEGEKSWEAKNYKWRITE
jgi:serine/threonine protein kinase